MTEHEAAIVSAYTGILIGSFLAMQRYAEERLGRSIWTHEFASNDLFMELKEAAREDFMSIEVTAREAVEKMEEGK